MIYGHVLPYNASRIMSGNWFRTSIKELFSKLEMEFTTQRAYQVLSLLYLLFYYSKLKIFCKGMAGYIYIALYIVIQSNCGKNSLFSGVV